MTVLNSASNTGLLLEEGKDYEIQMKYEYAVDRNSTFYPISQVYTSNPGVYKVIYKINSLVNSSDVVESSFLLLSLQVAPKLI